jgi:hypothetical protein
MLLSPAAIEESFCINNPLSHAFHFFKGLSPILTLFDYLLQTL